MVQPKYSPEEALERVKLMMKYDMSKTLNENRKIIQEQSTSQVGLATAGGLAASSAAGAATAASLATTLGAAGSAVPIVGTAAGIVIGYGLGTLIDWAANHDLGESGFRQVMKACSAKGVDKLVPKLSKAEVRNIAYTIEDAKGQWNDDEDAIEQALRQIPTIADLCAVDKKIPGGLSNFLDDLTDSPDEWKRFTRPLAGMIEDTEIVLTPEETKKTGQKTKTDNSKTNTNTVSKYKDCSGTYTYLCKAKPIETVQACLGLVPDGKYGPKTQAKLKSMGYESFKDSDINKICGKSDSTQQPEIGGEDISINTSDTNF
jgi:hypothetical protein